jgi:ABC-type glycerol-3-phosphate transport system permease component
VSFLSWCYDAYKELLLLIVIYLAPMPLLMLIVPLYLIVSSKMQLLLQTKKRIRGSRALAEKSG